MARTDSASAQTICRSFSFITRPCYPNEDDPLRRLLRAVGPIETFRLLTTGDIAPAALAAYAETVLTVHGDRPADPVLLARFAAAGVPSTPFAYEEDVTGETTLALIEADPLRGKAEAPLLSDAEWVSLQGICGG